jgi:hypothetical protein
MATGHGITAKMAKYLSIWGWNNRVAEEFLPALGQSVFITIVPSRKLMHTGAFGVGDFRSFLKLHEV